jgi:hypothetical protein
MLKSDIYEGEVGILSAESGHVSFNQGRQNEVPSPTFATAVRIEPVPGAKKGQMEGEIIAGRPTASLF